MAREPVRLNVYDMYWLNDYAANLGIGIYHTGVEVYGVEYAYGGHPFTFTGIFENAPKDAEELGENFKFRESVLVGETDFDSGDVRRMIELMGTEYQGDKYHLISKNCNHFTSALAKTLTGIETPGWVNRLASISGSIPFLERMLPQEWLTPVALQHSLEERRRSNAASMVAGGGNASQAARLSSSSTATGGVGNRPTTANKLGSFVAYPPPVPKENGPLSDSSGSPSSSPSSPALSRLWTSIKNIGGSSGSGSSTSNSGSGSNSNGPNCYNGVGSNSNSSQSTTSTAIASPRSKPGTPANENGPASRFSQI